MGFGGYVNKVKVIDIKNDKIIFENGAELYSVHDQECCENHYLSFDNLVIADFEGLEFDLTKDSFFKRIDGYGIELIPINGYPIRIPGYGYNNGWYSSDIDLILDFNNGSLKKFNVSNCQIIEWHT